MCIPYKSEDTFFLNSLYAHSKCAFTYECIKLHVSVLYLHKHMCFNMNDPLNLYNDIGKIPLFFFKK